MQQQLSVRRGRALSPPYAPPRGCGCVATVSVSQIGHRRHCGLSAGGCGRVPSRHAAVCWRLHRHRRWRACFKECTEWLPLQLERGLGDSPWVSAEGEHRWVAGKQWPDSVAIRAVWHAKLSG